MKYFVGLDTPDTTFDPTQTLDGETVKAGEIAVVKSLEQAGFPLKP